MAACLVTGLSAQSATKQDKLYRSWLADEPYITDIVIEGNTRFSDAKIKSKLFSRENSLWQSLKSGSRNKILRYSINRDTLEVKYLYLKEGYLNIKVNEQVEVYPVDSSAIIYITINEGSQFLVGHVSAEINDSLPISGRLRNRVERLKRGEPVNPIRLNAIAFEIKTYFANNGHPYATVEHSIDTTAGPQNTHVIFTATEGPLVHFGDIIIDSLKDYSPNLVEREITFKKGDIYSREKIIESQKRLYSTSLFNSINLDFYQKSFAGPERVQSTEPDFRFSAIERKAQYITIKTGASQDSLQDLTWDFSAAWGKRNVFKSRRVEFSVTSRFVIFTDWRIVLHRYQMRFTEPWFAGLRLPLTLTARFEPGVKSQVQDYRVQTWLLALSTRKEWSEQLYAVISGEYENVNIYGVRDADSLAQIKEEEEISVRRKLTAVLVRDTRIDKFIPKSGSFTTYYAQYVGGFLGGDDSFIKLEYSWARYQPAFGNVIYASRLKGGYIKEFGSSTEVPINDRFYLGGANTIRGFDEGDISPRADYLLMSIDTTVIDTSINPPEVLAADTAYIPVSEAVGANAYLILNQELRFPLFWKFWGSAFVDIGNGFESLSEITPDKLLFAYGAGIQFMSPAGPLRLDYAHHLENGRYQEGDNWHITILYAF
ncbi:MAG: BamA/TamA family outer membrane protein [Candidatus Zixiibacteriota bacterium]